MFRSHYDTILKYYRTTLRLIRGHGMHDTRIPDTDLRQWEWDVWCVKRDVSQSLSLQCIISSNFEQSASKSTDKFFKKRTWLESSLHFRSGSSPNLMVNSEMVPHNAYPRRSPIILTIQ
ncbi:hypothetical protein J6590_002015 [Homalodisca vitripennis]|nr:hypothetical protein J6590_002015 [Homalodisca vitripennis]